MSLKAIPIKDKSVTFVGTKSQIDFLNDLFEKLKNKVHYTTDNVGYPDGIPITREEIGEYVEAYLSMKALDELTNFMNSNETATVIDMKIPVAEYKEKSDPKYIDDMNKVFHNINNKINQFPLFNVKQLYERGMSARPLKDIERITFLGSLDFHDKLSTGFNKKDAERTGYPSKYIYNGKQYNSGYVVIMRVRDGARIDLDDPIKIDKSSLNRINNELKGLSVPIKLNKPRTIGDVVRFLAEKSMPPNVDNVVADKPIKRILYDQKGVEHMYIIVPVYGNTQTKIDFKDIEYSNEILSMIDRYISLI